MFRYKRFTTAAILAAFLCSLCLFGVVNSSEAAKITSLTTGYVGGDYGDGGWTSVRLKTDEAVSSIDWYVNDEFEEMTMHGPGTTWVYRTLDGLPGLLKGKKNKITVRAWFWDGVNSRSDIKSVEFRVFKPIVQTAVDGRDGRQLETDVEGTVVLYFHYFDGNNIVMDGQVFAWNDSDNAVNCDAWFRHTRMDQTAVPFRRQQPASSGVIGGENNSSMYLEYADTSYLNFNVGRLINVGERYTLNAHIHLTTGRDDRHVDSTNEFTWKDNP